MEKGETIRQKESYIKNDVILAKIADFSLIILLTNAREMRILKTHKTNISAYSILKRVLSLPGNLFNKRGNA